MKRLFYTLLTLVALGFAAQSAVCVMAFVEAAAQQQACAGTVERRHDGSDGQGQRLLPSDRNATTTAMSEARHLSQALCRPQRVVAPSMATSPRGGAVHAVAHSGVAAQATGAMCQGRDEAPMLGRRAPADYYVIAIRRLLC